MSHRESRGARSTTGFVSLSGSKVFQLLPWFIVLKFFIHSICINITHTTMYCYHLIYLVAEFFKHAELDLVEMNNSYVSFEYLLTKHSLASSLTCWVIGSMPG